MPDVAGFRAKFGVLIPSTNTIVEADCSALHIPGVTFHTGRMYIAHHKLGSDRAFEQLLAEQACYCHKHGSPVACLSGELAQ